MANSSEDQSRQEQIQAIYEKWEGNADLFPTPIFQRLKMASLQANSSPSLAEDMLHQALEMSKKPENMHGVGKENQRDFCADLELLVKAAPVIEQGVAR